MTAYYNEFDPFAVEWLTNLSTRGAIAPGIIDHRSIEELTPFELTYYTQVHLFAGIGVWSYALRAAGWRDDRRVWTCSCPCQPFSSSGKGDGFDDPRHLWPHAKRLIQERRPFVIFGEQVSAGGANAWFDLVQTDLERMGYAFGLCPFPAASVGAPHQRDRAYWCAILLADANCQRLERERENCNSERWEGSDVRQAGLRRGTGGCDGTSNVLAYTHDAGQRPGTGRRGSQNGEGEESRNDARRSGASDLLAYSDGVKHQKCNTQSGKDTRSEVERETAKLAGPGPVNGYWDGAVWIQCRDGLYRPAQSGTMPLAYGITRDMGRMQPRLARLASRNRNGRIKGYGNAIVAPAAIEFIKAVMVALEDLTWTVN